MVFWLLFFAFLVLLWSYEIITSYISPAWQGYMAGLSTLGMIILTEGLVSLQKEVKKQALVGIKAAIVVMLVRFTSQFWLDVAVKIWPYFKTIFGVKGF